MEKKKKEKRCPLCTHRTSTSDERKRRTLEEYPSSRKCEKGMNRRPGPGHRYIPRPTFPSCSYTATSNLNYSHLGILGTPPPRRPTFLPRRHLIFPILLQVSLIFGRLFAPAADAPVADPFFFFISHSILTSMTLSLSYNVRGREVFFTTDLANCRFSDRRACESSGDSRMGWLLIGPGLDSTERRRSIKTNFKGPEKVVLVFFFNALAW